MRRLLLETERCFAALGGTDSEPVVLAPLRGATVTCFNTHPAHRTAPVFRELFAQLHAVAKRHGITALLSNVYKTNRLSMNFHEHLGFKVTRENAKGVEFHATLADLTAKSPFISKSVKPTDKPDSVQLQALAGLQK